MPFKKGPPVISCARREFMKLKVGIPEVFIGRHGA
jgi:hypothetical protein